MGEKLPQRKRGIRDAVVAVLAAALIMSPSYFASITVHRFNVDITVAAVTALALFLVGVFLLFRLLK